MQVLSGSTELRIQLFGGQAQVVVVHKDMHEHLKCIHSMELQQTLITAMRMNPLQKELNFLTA